MQDLASAIAAAERLTDYTPVDGGKKKVHPQSKGHSQQREQSHESSKGKNGGASSSHASQRDSSHTKSTGASSNYHHNKQFKCILCGGPHKTFKCPQRATLNALLASQRDPSHEDAGRSDNDETHMGALHLLNALKQTPETQGPQRKVNVCGHGDQRENHPGNGGHRSYT